MAVGKEERDFTKGCGRQTAITPINGGTLKGPKSHYQKSPRCAILAIKKKSKKHNVFIQDVSNSFRRQLFKLGKIASTLRHPYPSDELFNINKIKNRKFFISSLFIKINRAIDKVFMNKSSILKSNYQSFFSFIYD